jgi:hypothetical protein
MIRRLAVVLSLLFAAASLFGNPALFSRYEDVRKALISQSLKDAQTASAALARVAQGAGQPEIATQAAEVSKAADLARARAAFWVLSQSMIKLRNASKEPRPAVYYCSMEKKSWLQPKGTVGNPYVDKSMTSCGEEK